MASWAGHRLLAHAEAVIRRGCLGFKMNKSCGCEDRLSEHLTRSRDSGVTKASECPAGGVGENQPSALQLQCLAGERGAA